MMTVHFVLRMTTPEGRSYEYMDRFMQRVSQLVDDSIPQRKLLLYLASQDLVHHP
jgi:HAE1 family hydrophobic/amphiphilic exporter-1/multidrug efflux pump